MTKGYDEVLFAKFTEADGLAGRLVTTGSSLGNVIFRKIGDELRSGKLSNHQ